LNFNFEIDIFSKDQRTERDSEEEKHELLLALDTDI